jgi:uracil-DNA glycosylase
MLNHQPSVQREIERSALRWWADAGVDALVDDVPTPWLDRGVARKVAEAAHAPPTKVADTLAELVAQVTSIDALDSHAPHDQRIAASGNPTAELMVVIDMPEPDDWRSGQLMSGEAGTLFDAMLSAIKLDRSDCYIAALCPARLAGGMIPAELIDPLASAMRRHIVLAAPKKLWAMGVAVNRVVIGADAVPGRGDKRFLNYEGRNMEAVGSFSPRLLLQQPKRKAGAWADMQALMRGNDA